ncbi:1-phosphofructokinase [Rudaeicoccus suwonensis]|uniref:1-phosphofructokinase n=1 Tax=Rudaeicoccus suwonensis TaxID=657409 RepID=A0A561DX43_9MICO|nr:1-phosphofructokinase [Rudaeicoccus suwonensis]TWE07939.1 1-phosphofructokinase/6-phosphofructokinase 2 [Rudaeicoccus suwonensis]
MIITLTPNPSLDRTLSVGDLVRGEVNRAVASTLEPGGKGVNVTRALLANGSDSVAVFPCGGNNGRLMELLISEEHVATRIVPVASAIRVNTAIIEPDGTTTKVNEAGPHLSPAEVACLLDTTEELITGAGWLALCGALPPGLPDDFTTQVVRRARAAGASVAIDASGAALRAGVDACPQLIKPNRTELAELVGRDLETVDQVCSAARDVIREGVTTVIVSLGKDGALAVGERCAIHAHAVAPKPKSTVGAGDSLLAGVLSALDSGHDLAESLRTGVVWGTAAVQLPGSRMPTPADLAGVHATITTDLDGSRRLTD